MRQLPDESHAAGDAFPLTEIRRPEQGEAARGGLRRQIDTAVVR